VKAFFQSLRKSIHSLKGFASEDLHGISAMTVIHIHSFPRQPSCNWITIRRAAIQWTARINARSECSNQENGVKTGWETCETATVTKPVRQQKKARITILSTRRYSTECQQISNRVPVTLVMELKTCRLRGGFTYAVRHR
jgi:hypothetical protein